jgi:hypothetical protein
MKKFKLQIKPAAEISEQNITNFDKGDLLQSKVKFEGVLGAGECEKLVSLLQSFKPEIENEEDDFDDDKGK